MTADVETVVVGAGVVGLAVACALARRGNEVMVLEQHGRIGAETSSRSSEVIHAGLYYPPGSLKARLCVKGKELLYRFCEQNGVPFRRCGKILVATQEEDVASLAAIAETARRNGVADLVALSRLEARQLEPELECVGAYFSPSTGVIDSHGLMVALDGYITAGRGAVLLNRPVMRIKARNGGGFKLEVQSACAPDRLTTKNLVIAAGLGATRLGKMLTGAQAYRVPETYPVKGHYFALSGRSPFRHLIYPMPDSASLGIHVTLDLAGRAKFGPDVEWKTDVSYDFEDVDGRRLATFVREVRRYWPGLPDGALTPGYTGMRPKLTRAGEPPADFAIHGPAEHGVPRLVALYGIESPGLTASLAIGELVAAKLM